MRWYSDIPDRLFPRTKSVIGRSVYNCHPPRHCLRSSGF
ncbi:PAS domain-containing protein [Limosilactobacillus mucosae]